MRKMTEQLWTSYSPKKKPRKQLIKGDKPILIFGHIHDVYIHRICCNNGNSTEIMYKHCFSKLPETMRKE